MIIKGSDPRLQVRLLPTGISRLDAILGGGFPRNRSSIIFGDYSSGKTYLAQILMGVCIKRGLTVLYVDIENVYHPEWFVKTGVDIEKLDVGRPATGEEAIDMIITAMRDGYDLVVADSLAAMEPSQESEDPAAKQSMGLQSRMLNKMWRKIASANRKGTAFVAINQIRASMGPYAGESLPGGMGQEFAASLIIRLRRKGWIEDKDKKRIGFNIEVSVRKNKLAAPFGECLLPFLFEGRLDEASMQIEEGLENGTIINRGPYYYIGDNKFLGKEALRTYLEEQRATSRDEV